MSGQRDGQHGASDVHGVGALADDDAVRGQQLGHVVEQCVVVHGLHRLQSQSLEYNQNQGWINNNSLLHQKSSQLIRLIFKL